LASGPESAAQSGRFRPTRAQAADRGREWSSSPHRAVRGRRGRERGRRDAGDAKHAAPGLPDAGPASHAASAGIRHRTPPPATPFRSGGPRPNGVRAPGTVADTTAARPPDP
jgi:hypothetical protein